MIREVAVVGASVGGIHFVKALRRNGYDGVIRVIGEEPGLPYDRPPLSKEFLQGTRQPGDILLAPEEFYRDAGVELLLGVRAERIGQRVLHLSDGMRVPFDRLFAATGSRPTRLRIPCADLPGVHYLRTIDDATALREDLLRSHRAVIVGGGFIGAEVAAACRMAGLAVTIVDAMALPFERVFGETVARALLDLQLAHGVSVRLGTGIQSIVGHVRAEGVQLADGDLLPADLVVVGVGARPNLDLFEASHIPVEGGVLVDEFLETGLAGVLAGGDCARFGYRGDRIRIEHWDNARAMGEHAARTVLGEKLPFAASPFFWTDQYDRTVQYFGHHRNNDETIVRGDVAAYAFTVFYLEGGRIAAACTTGRPREALAVRRLVERGLPVAPEALRNPDANLKQLAAGPSAAP